MSRNTGNNSTSPGKGGNSLLIGVLIGALVGVGMVAGVIWYLKNSPSPFTHKEQKAVKPPVEAAKSAPPAQPATAASGVGSDKPRFEFYKVLTDKQDATVAVPARPAEKPKAADSKPAAAYEPKILQAGSFSSETDAEKLKAKLALLGMEAGIQTATIPDKGVWYRVRLGPYKTADEMNHARNFLKQNGVESTPMHAQ
jgi:cell division protein FtsN